MKPKMAEEESGWRSRGLLFAGGAALAAVAGAAYLMTRGKTGKGTKTYPTGEVYEGDLVNGRAEGFGTSRTVLGDVLTGQWKDDVAHGKVRFVFSDHTFEGEAFGSHWKGIIRLSHGVEIDFDGVVDSVTMGMTGHVVLRTADGRERYRGPHMNNVPEGDDCWQAVDDGFYVGQMRGGLREGRGTLRANGVVYEGEWKGGHKHGQGKMQYANGEVYEGTWCEGAWADGLLRRPDGRTDTVLGGKIFK
jgi:hypothetical protein